MAWRGSGDFDFSIASGDGSVVAGNDVQLYGVNVGGNRVGVRGINNTPTQVAIVVNGQVPVDIPTGPGSIATAINDIGQMCGWSWNDAKSFMYDQAAAGGVTWIDPPPAAGRCLATAISRIGEVLGVTDKGHGFFWNGGASVDLGQAAFVEDVNDAGIVCGSLAKAYPSNYAPGICYARLAAPTWVEIPLPLRTFPGALPFVGGHANGINNAVDVVGTCWWAGAMDLDQTAFIHQRGTVGSSDLNSLITDSRWRLQYADRINDAGQIIGRGLFKGQLTAFLLNPRMRPVPVQISLPGLIALILGGVAVDGGGWGIIGNQPIPIGPWGPWLGIADSKRDALIALALDEIAMYIEDGDTRSAVRSALIRAAAERLQALTATASQGRPSPVGRPFQTPVAQAFSKGKTSAALRRLGP
jgi:hypothetical protein